MSAARVGMMMRGRVISTSTSPPVAMLADLAAHLDLIERRPEVACVLLTLLLTGDQRVMHWWLMLVARRQSQELFMLNILLSTLGLAWLTEHAGLSMAMGSFMAGMLIAETDFKHKVENDIRPFHDVLLGLFFITIGMKLDWEVDRKSVV